MTTKVIQADREAAINTVAELPQARSQDSAISALTLDDIKTIADAILSSHADPLRRALEAAQALATCCMATGCYSHEEIAAMARATKPTFDSALSSGENNNGE